MNLPVLPLKRNSNNQHKCNNFQQQIFIMKSIVCKCRVLVECESTSYELRANDLRVYPIASCEMTRLQVAS